MKENHTKNTSPVIWVVVGVFIGTIVIVLLGMIILWRNDPPADEAATTPSSDVINTSVDEWSGDAKDVDSYEPQSSRGEEYTPNRYDYNPQSK